MDADFSPLFFDAPASLPIDLLPDRLDFDVDRFEPVPDYADLRRSSAAWLRADPSPQREALARDLLELEPLLSRSFLLDQPNVAGMGVGAWDRAVTGAELDMVTPEEKAKRMVRKTALEKLLDEEPVVRPTEPPIDPQAIRRGADLVDAVARLEGLLGRAEDLPPDVAERLARLRAELLRRLGRERSHDARLDAALSGTALRNPGAVAAGLRETADAAPVPFGETRAVLPRRSATNPYAAAIEEAAAARRLDAPLVLEPAAAERLEQVRAAATRATQKATAAKPGSSRERAQVEKARRLLAEETALTRGRPGATIAGAAGAQTDTLALRRELASREAAGARPVAAGPSSLTVKAGLPEIPIHASRAPGARIVGYLTAGEAVRALQASPAGGFLRVSVPGRAQPGWVDAGFVAPAGTRTAPWPQKLEKPAALQRGFSIPPPQPAGASLPVETVGELVEEPADAGASAASLAPPAPPARPEATPAPLTIDQIDVSGLSGPGADLASGVLESGLGQLEAVLRARLAASPDLARRIASGTGGAQTVSVTVDIPTAAATDARLRGRVIADRVADAILRQGAAHVGRLVVKVRVQHREVGEDPATDLLSRLAAGDSAGVAEVLANERRTLDATSRHRLTQFFGDDLEEVALFAGPMAGALARSLSAEAFTHGQQIFFDPKHFRPDTPQGEALLAHEMTHTTQDGPDQRSAKHKEAEALATEAAYLDWIQPGGAPLAKESAEPDVTSRDAQAAGDREGSTRGGHRADLNREKKKAAGPRAGTAQQEERVDQVTERVLQLLKHGGIEEGDRLGKITRRRFRLF